MQDVKLRVDPGRSAAPKSTPAEASARPMPRSLFHEAWWLQAASGGRTEWAEVQRDGVVVGALPFVRRGRFGFVNLGLPPYTRTLGPLFSLPPAKPVQTAANIRRITRELLLSLPRHDRFFQWLDPEDDSAIAFSLAGCTLYQSFTFRVPAGVALGAMWDNVEGHLRRQVRAARGKMQAQTHTDFDRFVAVSRRERDSRRNLYHYPTLERIFRACIERGQAAILSAVTTDGADGACVILVWGHGTLYYWMPAIDRSRGGGGANAFLLWSALEFAAAKALLFDSDGYASGAAGKFFCGFALPLSCRSGVAHLTAAGRLYQACVTDAKAARMGVAPIVHEARDRGAEEATRRPPRG
jgi:Acetyltransferase (GNAT) domain